MQNLAYFICGQAGIVPLAIGKPGVAKTASMLALAKKIGYRLYILTGSIREPADIGGYPTLKEIIHDGQTIHYMAIVPPEYVVRAMEEPHILFIDELTCCHPGTQSAMLAICAERRVGDTTLDERTLIFAACNPPGTAANGYPLEATMANRLVHLKWEFPRDAWLQGMRNGLNYPSPAPPILPDDWKKYIVGTASLIAEFHVRVPGFLEPEENETGDLVLSTTERSSAFPTPRTWDMAARGMAAAKSLADDIEDADDIASDILNGCVGFAAAESYFDYVDTLDLPDPNDSLIDMIRAQTNNDNDEVLAAIVPDPKRADKVRAFLGSVTSAIIVDNSLERWNAAQEIFRQSIKRHKEVSIVCAGPLYNNKPKGAKITQDMVETVANCIGYVLDTKDLS